MCDKGTMPPSPPMIRLSLIKVDHFVIGGEPRAATSTPCVGVNEADCWVSDSRTSLSATCGHEVHKWSAARRWLLGREMPPLCAARPTAAAALYAAKARRPPRRLVTGDPREKSDETKRHCIERVRLCLAVRTTRQPLNLATSSKGGVQLNHRPHGFRLAVLLVSVSLSSLNGSPVTSAM